MAAPSSDSSPLFHAAEVDPASLSLFRRLESLISQLLDRRPPLVAQTAAREGLIEPYVFRRTGEGGGVFGHWDVDSAGLPVYHYTMDQRRSLTSFYLNTANQDRRDHWHQIGNNRITGLVSNDGVVQCFLADRGGIFLNQF